MPLLSLSQPPYLSLPFMAESPWPELISSATFHHMDLYPSLSTQNTTTETYTIQNAKRNKSTTETQQNATTQTQQNAKCNQPPPNHPLLPLMHQPLLNHKPTTKATPTTRPKYPTPTTEETSQQPPPKQPLFNATETTQSRPTIHDPRIETHDPWFTTHDCHRLQPPRKTHLQPIPPPSPQNTQTHYTNPMLIQREEKAKKDNERKKEEKMKKRV